MRVRVCGEGGWGCKWGGKEGSEQRRRPLDAGSREGQTCLAPWPQPCPYPTSSHPACPHTRSFNLLKPSCILINVSRGGLINTNALIAALEANKLGGVAMDV